MNKIVIVSTHSIHTVKFVNSIQSLFSSVVLIVDRTIEELSHIKQYEISFSLKNPIRLFFQTLQLRSILSSEAPDIIHVQQVGSHAWSVAVATRKLNAKIVMTAWGSDILINPHKNLLLRLMVQYALRRSDIVTCDSFYIANRINEISQKNHPNIQIVYFGINPIKNIPATRNKVIYSNRLHKPLYRIDLIIRAFARFLSNSDDQDWLLKIAGTGDETNSYIDLATKLGIRSKIEFLGWVDEKANVLNYSESEFYISIPESDGTSVSLLEAMYYGAIPIVSNLPSNLEWINHEVNGIVVSNFSTDFFSQAISVDWSFARKLNKIIIEKKATTLITEQVYRNLYSQITH